MLFNQTFAPEEYCYSRNKKYFADTNRISCFLFNFIIQQASKGCFAKVFIAEVNYGKIEVCK